MGVGKSKDYKPESKKKGRPDSLTQAQLKIALSQMEKTICKIKLADEKIGTGFFCLIPFPDKFNPLPVLITCNHVLDKNNISEGSEINFSLNNEKINKLISINNSRKTYTSIEKDITIIEIKPKDDKVGAESFLDIDENVFKDEDYSVYKDKSVYINHYESGKESKNSIGVIKNIKDDKFNIQHDCTTQEGSSGSPIINAENAKVIGVHKGEAYLNVGTLLKIPIDEFNKLHYDSNNCKMSIIIKDENQKSYPITCKKTDKFLLVENEFSERNIQWHQFNFP